MVVQTPTTLALLFLGCRDASHITPVVVTQQNRHIVGHTQSCVIVVLYLFIECPYLGGLLGRAPCHLFDDAALVADDALHQFGVCLVAHGLVAVAAHTDGDDVVGAVHALDALTEETVETWLVGGVVPGAPSLAVTCILLMIPGHRLVMRSSHHDAHGVCGFQVLGIIGIECPSPHGRPKVIALQAQDQLKDLFIESMVTIVGAEGVLHPGGQTGRLVVEEQASIAHSRFPVCIFACLDIDGFMFFHGNVGPVVPW